MLWHSVRSPYTNSWNDGKCTEMPASVLNRCTANACIQILLTTALSDLHFSSLQLLEFATNEGKDEEIRDER